MNHSAASSTRDEPIELVEYNPAWPALFDAERRLLQEMLAPWLAGPVEHIGSTAVPGLPAKPIIDIMAPVHSLAESTAAIAAASALNYLYYPYKPEQLHWFCKPSPAHRTHHLHLVPLGSTLWHQRLEFRDALRGSTDLTARYAALKHQLALQYRHDREGYTEAKGPFIAQVLAKV
ncbi:GrpB family protein [Acidovorax sp. Root217]|uniref:GrpB family protein n=1 Tax=Acidovorax sp. Root217 TaxID=1736492 RepID=UPI0009EB1C55|nr:GrpB family protein [Acidovorax sp. Root217]